MEGISAKDELKVMKKARAIKVNNEEIASKIPRTVLHDKAFYFFTGVGQYSGEFAVSLADFYQKLKTIDIKSLDFHFKRRDFEKWIRGTIGDVDLADKINEIKKSAQGEELRVKIYQTVKRRLTELKKLSASERADLKRSRDKLIN